MQDPSYQNTTMRRGHDNRETLGALHPSPVLVDPQKSAGTAFMRPTRNRYPHERCNHEFKSCNAL
eukprot:3749366-Pyramimonas_sp.AAC.1